MKRPQKALIFGFMSLAAAMSNAWAVVTMDTVAIGDLGNAADPATGYGAVSYDYNIAKYEITLDQYCEFLNAIAATDTYGLYDTQLASINPIAGIARSGASGSYTYSVIGGGNRPVTFITWFRAARFVNWLENGQPAGSQTAATTEDGTYTLNGALSGVNYPRKATANNALPTKDEWYKAAYYQPAAQGGDVDDYWLYPTRSNTQPNSRNGSTTDPNSANYFYDDGIANAFNNGYAVANTTVVIFSGQNYLSDVGAFSVAGTFYGTYDQAGNVREWNEEIVAGSSRGLAGGTWNSGEIPLQATHLDARPPTDVDWDFGFRVVTIPKPTVSISVTGAVPVITWTGTALQTTTNLPVSTNAVVWQTITNATKPHVVFTTNDLRFFRAVK